MTAISPAAELVRTMRESLAASGLVRRELDGSVYWSGGQAPSPVLVLLHGTNDQAGTWSRVVPMLITLAGNSFGAWIALLYALAHPARVKASGARGRRRTGASAGRSSHRIAKPR